MTSAPVVNVAAAAVAACAPVEEPLGLVVKNTFLCVGLQTPTRQRRSNSLPPSLRSLESKAPLEHWGADDSTDACTDGGASEEDTTCSEGGGSAASPAAPTPAAAASPRISEKSEDKQQPQRTALSSRAAAWTPGGATTSVAGHFLLEVASLMLAVQASLQSSHFPLKVSTWEDGGCWTLALCMGPSSLAFMEQVLTFVKQALLNAAESSTSVFVMGYRRLPFTTTPTGFAAMLGAMEDESRACWDAYGNGVCCRGAACKWKHPASMVPVNVVLLLDPQLENVLTPPLPPTSYLDSDEVYQD